MDATNQAYARIFKAFCDENRIAILGLLRDGEKCACVLLENLHIAQSTLSHHMKILCESGAVACREEGKWSYYSLSDQGCERARTILADITKPSSAKTSSKVCACR
jgi:ArsR family transcriptional regulator